ncbi:hypothetical protein SKAU_G00244990 [Synaphobranchus kaupii]|uniref:Reverse transcriptase n=1 Tax=Synaphobranchus kaupii TaxID=118154 RepID=A0A9Q1IP99_SYNKA|nr:hypothetical protein SKAU_G00244990 [Synaphobranchus kaupii]
MIYKVCSSRFGEVIAKKASQTERGRREGVMHQLVQSRQQLRKATDLEREGLKVLWDEDRGRDLLEERTSGNLKVTREVLEAHNHTLCSDPRKKEPLGSPGYVPRPAEPEIQFNTMPPRLIKVRQVVEKARSASAPGPNGIPYKLYKNCPRVLKLLWNLMRMARGKQCIPSAWQKAMAVYIPKELDSTEIGQFRSIVLVNVGENLLFCSGKKMTTFLMGNG